MSPDGTEHRNGKVVTIHWGRRAKDWRNLGAGLLLLASVVTVLSFSFQWGVGKLGYQRTTPNQRIDALTAVVDTISAKSDRNFVAINIQTSALKSAIDSTNDELRDMNLIQCIQLRRYDPDLLTDRCVSRLEQEQVRRQRKKR